MLSSTQKNIYKVFGNRERVMMICCLQQKQSVSDLLEKCSLSQSAVSQHLAVLKGANVASCERKGKQQLYYIVDKKALRIAKQLCTY